MRRAALDASQEDRAQDRQIEKLRAMSDLEKEMLAMEQEHQSRMRDSLRGLDSKEMIAIQATELAKTEGGGAAWAQAISGQAEADGLRERLEDKDQQAQQMIDVMERAANLAQGAANQQVYEKSMDAMSTVAASRASPGPALSCGSCGAPLRPGARFCGGCGAET